MKYTINDLKNGKVILLNNNSKKTKQILQKAWIAKMKSYEAPAYKHFFKYKEDYMGCDDDKSSPDKWPLHADGTRREPAYLVGKRGMFHVYGIEGLPIQKASDFKI